MDLIYNKGHKLNGGDAMGRPLSGKPCIDTTRYTQKNGWIYLYERERQYDPATKRYKTVRKKLLGKYPPGDPCTGPPMPTRPKRKSRSACDTATSGAGNPAATKENEQSSFVVKQNSSAMIDILYHIAENSGVKKEIESLFQSDEQGFAKKIITSAMYLFATDGDSWPGMQGWTRKYLGALPYTWGPISEDMLHDMFVELGERKDIREKIFIARANALHDEEMLALDSSTYVMETETGEILIVRNAMHKDGVLRPLLKIVFVYAIISRRPIAYALIPANTPDSKTVYNVLKQLKMLKLNKLELIADGGYATEEDIGYYLSQGQHFITHVEANLKWISPLIDQYREEVFYEGPIIPIDSNFCGYRVKVNKSFKYTDQKTEKEKVIDGKINVFIYYSHYRMGKEEENLRSTYVLYEELLMNGAVLGEDKSKIEKFANKYMIITKDSQGNIIRIIRNKENWKKAVNRLGFIVLVADKEDDVKSAFEKYRLREKIEEMIKNHKTHAGGKKIAKHKTETIDGQAFIQFEALSLRGSFEAEIKNLMNRLAVPTGNSLHDTSNVYKQERKVCNWLLKTSLVNILKWFDAIKKVDCSYGGNSYEWIGEYLERDKIVLRGLGMIKEQGEDSY